MPLILNNPNAVGSANADIIVPFNGTGVANTASGGDGDDTIFGNRLAEWFTTGNANQTYNTAFSIDNTIGWSVGGTLNPLVGNNAIPHTSVYAQSVGGGYFCFSLNLAAGAQMTLDIDSARSFASGYFDSFVEVLDATTGAVLAFNDDSSTTSGGLGSFETTDSFATFTAGSAGTYIIRVGRFLTTTTSQALQDGDMFALTVSASGHAASFGATGGDSAFNGDGGNDYLVGYIGHDTLNGGTGDDQLFGFTGNDTLNGGADDDVMDGATALSTSPPTRAPPAA